MNAGHLQPVAEAMFGGRHTHFPSLSFRGAGHSLHWPWCSAVPGGQTQRERWEFGTNVFGQRVHGVALLRSPTLFVAQRVHGAPSRDRANPGAQLRSHSACEPPAHFLMHAMPRGCDSVPGGHFMHLLDRHFGLYVPSGHFSHGVCCRLSGNVFTERVPGGHTVQCVMPNSVFDVPGGHVLQDPGLSPNSPGKHSPQETKYGLSFGYVPRGHCVQSLMDVAGKARLYVFGGHLVHALTEPFAENVPAGHGRHSRVPGSVYMPGSQRSPWDLARATGNNS